MASKRKANFWQDLCLLVAFVFLPVALGACASSPQLWQPPADFDSAPLWAMHWQQDESATKLALESATWEQSGSIEGERYRQAYAIQRGQRLPEYQHADQRVKRQPNDPAAQYLRARLLQDPIRLSGEFQRLAQRWPNHAWIQLGAAGSLQNIGKFRQAARHLQAAPDWPDAREFRLLVTARQLLGQNHSEPWLPLMDLAFLQGSPDALYEVQQYATQKQNATLQRLCRAEIDLRQGADAEEGERLRVLLNRALAELNSERIQDVDELLQKMEVWAELLNLPQGWSKARRYRLPGGFGVLVPPESSNKEWAQLLERHQTALMIGESVATEPAMLVLHDVDRRNLKWPGLEQPIELVLAQSGESNQQTYFAGAALFRGFYARHDLSNALADNISNRLQRLHDHGITAQDAFQVLNPFDVKVQNFQGIEQALTEEMDRGHQDVGRLPEDLDLPLRIRLAETWQAAEQGEKALRATVREMEWRQLLLHESGHLPDVLPWTQDVGNIWKALGMGLKSLMRDGMLLGEWEYRAQLRALAAGGMARWTLAETVEIARTPQHPYFKPYRRLLADLWRISQLNRYPDLPDWVDLKNAEIASLAEQLMAQQGLSALPDDYVEQLLAD